MEFENNLLHVSLWPFIAIPLVTFFVFFFLKTIKRYLIPILKKQQLQLSVKKHILKFERVFWLGYFVACACILILSNPIPGIIICIILFAGGWNFIRNYTIGLIILLENELKIGQEIIFNDKSGTIVNLNNSNCEIKLQNGELLLIPYFNFSTSSIIKTSSSEKIVSKTIFLEVNKPCHILTQKLELEKEIVALPWLISKQKPVIDVVAETTTHYKLQVVIYGIDEQHLKTAEEKLKQSA